MFRMSTIQKIFPVIQKNILWHSEKNSASENRLCTPTFEPGIQKWKLQLQEMTLISKCRRLASENWTMTLKSGRPHSLFYTLQNPWKPHFTVLHFQGTNHRKFSFPSGLQAENGNMISKISAGGTVIIQGHLTFDSYKVDAKNSFPYAFSGSPGR